MPKHLPSREPLRRIHNQHAPQQIDAIVAEKREPLLPIRHRLRRLAGAQDRSMPQLRDARPRLLGRGPEHIARDFQLLRVRLRREEPVAQDELGEHDAHAPDVYFPAVVLASEEQLGRPVKARDDHGRHGPPRVRERARETEIRELERPVRGYEQVVPLDVAVQDEVLVAEPHGLREHAGPALDVGARVRYALVLPEALQVAEGQVLEHDVDVLVLVAVYGVELDDVWVRELGQVLDFADGVGRDAIFVFCVCLDLLDGYEAFGVVAVVACVDNGVCSLAEFGS